MADSFAQRVYATVSQIPRGKVATYKQIAELAGKPNAARAVGMLMARNQDTLKVPCHRVVGSDGSLKGYAFNGTEAKRAKLAGEGIHFAGSRISMHLDRWKPQ